MRVRTVLRRLAWTAAIVVVTAILVVSFLTIHASYRLHAALAELKAAGEPTTLEDLKSPAGAPERDAAEALVAITGVVSSAMQELTPVFDERRNAESLALSENAIARIRGAFERQPELHGQLVAAANLPEYSPRWDVNHPFRGSYDSNFSGAPARLLRYHALLALLDGDRETAFRDGLAVLRLARHLDKEPFHFSLIVTNGHRGLGADTLWRSMAAGPITAPLHAELEAELALHDEMAGYTRMLQSERVAGIHQFEKYEGLGYLWFWMNAEADYIHLMGELIRCGPAPAYQIVDELAALEAEADKARSFSRRSFPDVRRIRVDLDLSRARLRCLRVANAFQSVSLDEDVGETSLDALDIPADAKLNPFTGQPLEILENEEGLRIYSVGPETKDDGSKFAEGVDCGIGPFRLGRTGGE
jgi:hypothetical protein